MKKLVIYLALLGCIVCSCSKYYGDDYFNFSKEGGPWTFENVEIDGETLVIDSGDESDTAEYWPESSIDNDPLWTAEISWACVHYQPSRKALEVHVDNNDTGQKRSLLISGDQNGTTKRFAIRQAK